MLSLRPVKLSRASPAASCGEIKQRFGFVIIERHSFIRV